MTENNPVYDVQVIRFTKSASTKALSSFLKKGFGHYVCLGHFDMMEVSPLTSNEFPLQVIQDDLQKMQEQTQDGGENYQYPLYILKQQRTMPQGETNALKEFWLAEQNFLFITRFHCDRIDSNQNMFSKILEDRCRSFESNAYAFRGNLYISEETEGYIRFQDVHNCGMASVVFYDSLELGDIVGVVKSNSLTVAMKILQHLYECPVVSDAYTYCGVDCCLLQNPTFLNISPNRLTPLESTTMTHATTRFSVGFAKAADNLFAQIRQTTQRISFVTGTADIIVEWAPCTEAEFLREMSRIANFSELYEAFLDIITRVGTDYRIPIGSRQDLYQRTAFSELIPRAQEITKLLCESLDRWRYPMTRLLGTLKAMYENSVMDELSLQLIPGVNAFLERICYLKEHDLWEECYDDDVSNFLDWWAALASDISHLESQMVQHPELTPARHYIPAMVLQFERNFVMDYVKVIQKLDCATTSQEMFGTSRSFAPILFPTLEKNTHTMCPLDPEHDRNYTKDSPLCIFLPIQRLYQPWEIAYMLGHEIQHYSGDILRYRQVRLECLVQSAAAYVTSFLGAYVSANYRYQESTIKDERNFQQKIAYSIKQQLSSNTLKFAYLKSIKAELPGAMFKAGANQQNQKDFQNVLIKNETPQTQLSEIRQMCSLNTMEIGIQMDSAFSKHVAYLCHLYKECYADVSMILVLQCGLSDYYHCIYEDEEKCFGVSPHRGPEQRVFERHTDRLAMVILTLEHIQKGWTATPNAAEKSSSWFVSAMEKAKHWQSVRAFKNEEKYTWKRSYITDRMDSSVLLADEASQLEEYLLKCGKQLKLHLEQDVEINSAVVQLRNHLALVKSTKFDWNEIRKYLESTLSN